MDPSKKKSPRDVEKLYDTYAASYNDDFIPSTFTTARAALSFANDITWYYLLKYLPKNPSISILDAGGGDGFWAQKIFEEGYHQITVSDLSQEMLKFARLRFKSMENTQMCQFIKADIASMPQFADNSFDFVMSLFDPVSYCMRQSEAIYELTRVAKPGSSIVISVDTKFRRTSELIEAKQIEKAMELLSTNISYDFQHPQYNFTWEELNQLMEQAGCEVVEIVGAPVFMHQVSDPVREELEKFPEIRKKLLTMELKHCTNRSLVNFAGHLLMVGKKQ